MKIGRFDNGLAVNRCRECREIIPGWHRQTCSNKCRQKFYRRRKNIAAVSDAEHELQAGIKQYGFCFLHQPKKSGKKKGSK